MGAISLSYGRIRRTVDSTHSPIEDNGWRSPKRKMFIVNWRQGGNTKCPEYVRFAVVQCHPKHINLEVDAEVTITGDKVRCIRPPRRTHIGDYPECPDRPDMRALQHPIVNADSDRERAEGGTWFVKCQAANLGINGKCH